ncbi:hypothetical protein [Thiorhodococcus minor]|uniref:Uncharacterized protein n=1 Tax=Thiorhodococcus minor TaxID=57489 RepID=A0A6M0JYU1_9GAMM|nr:hypothetical protein [Thiorhodococcus minor]NEV62660.1 hypothetical protein [Thiorhodococcus minor]
MISYEQLAERHIKEHELREKKCKERDPDYQGQRRGLLGAVDVKEGAWRQATVNQAGPMGLIDAVAQDLESFVEIFERAPRCDVTDPPTRRRNVHIS